MKRQTYDTHDGYPIGELLKGVHRDIKPLLITAHEQRFRLVRGGGHIRVFGRNRQGEKDRSVSVGTTPSDARSVQNVKADLQRLGVNFRRGPRRKPVRR